MTRRSAGISGAGRRAGYPWRISSHPHAPAAKAILKSPAIHNETPRRTTSFSRNCETMFKAGKPYPSSHNPGGRQEERERREKQARSGQAPREGQRRLPGAEDDQERDADFQGPQHGGERSHAENRVDPAQERMVGHHEVNALRLVVQELQAADPDQEKRHPMARDAPAELLKLKHRASRHPAVESNGPVGKRHSMYPGDKMSRRPSESFP